VTVVAAADAAGSTTIAGSAAGYGALYKYIDALKGNLLHWLSRNEGTI
jgi:hypothetical protein